MRAGNLLDRLQAEPFKPFRVRLRGGMAIDVPVPQMIVSDDRAVVVTEFIYDRKGRAYMDEYRTVMLADIAEIIDAV